MRILTLMLTIGVLVVGAHALAWGKDGGDDTDLAALERKAVVLEKRVAYLLEREADLTKWILASEQRGRALETAVQRMRTQGFANRSIPAPSRETLLDGLGALGRDLGADLPAVTKEQAALLEAAARIR